MQGVRNPRGQRNVACTSCSWGDCGIGRSLSAQVFLGFSMFFPDFVASNGNFHNGPSFDYRGL
jgi:hypothetical protein